jgi:hypothetical protein
VQQAGSVVAARVGTLGSMETTSALLGGAWLITAVLVALVLVKVSKLERSLKKRRIPAAFTNEDERSPLSTATKTGLSLEKATSKEASGREVKSKEARAEKYLGTGEVAGAMRAPVLFKGAYLSMRPDAFGVRQLRLHGLGQKATYTAEAEAACLRDGAEHEAGDISECTCGFHAFKTLEDASTHEQHHKRSVVLEVVGSGSVVEHEKGWRYSRQRVTRVMLRSCSGCESRPATLLVVANAADETKDLVWPRCDQCVRGVKYTFLLSLEQVAKLLSAQVRDGSEVEVSTHGRATSRRVLDTLEDFGLLSVLGLRRVFKASARTPWR